MILEYMEQKNLSSAWLAGRRCTKCDSPNIFIERETGPLEHPHFEEKCLSCGNSRQLPEVEVRGTIC